MPTSSRMPFRRSVVALAAVVLGAAALAAGPGAGPASAARGEGPPAACPDEAVPDPAFRDVAPRSPHGEAIACAVWWGVSEGVAPGEYAPKAAVTRGQFASMLTRLLARTGDMPYELIESGFSDTGGHVHEDAIDVAAHLGVVEGVGGRFDADVPVDRAQMASMLVRLLGDVYGQEMPEGARFVDTAGNVHAANVRALAGVGVTKGVSPGLYAPAQPVTREQMASFLMRSTQLLVEAGRATVPSPAPPAGSPGCGIPTVTELEQTVDVDGRTRRFLVDVPETYDTTTPYPLVFAFPPLGTSADAFRTQGYGDLREAVGERAVVVHPEVGGVLGERRDDDADVRFFDVMLSSLRSTLCIHGDRIFAVGHDVGATFANHLGCVRGDVLRGVAAVSGSGPEQSVAGRCSGEVAVWIGHDGADPVAVEDSVSTLGHWLRVNNCGVATEPLGDAVLYTECDPLHPVVWAPFGDEAPALRSTAPAEIWSFFRTL